MSGSEVIADQPEVRLDERLPAASVERLREMGHRLAPPGRPGGAPGGILVDVAAGLLHGADAPLTDGVATGFSDD